MRIQNRQSKVFKRVALACLLTSTSVLASDAAQPSVQWGIDFDNGVQLMHRGQPKLAIEELTKAINACPHDMRARRQRAIAYFHARMYKESAADAKFVLQQPRLPRYFRGWGIQHCWDTYRKTAGKKPPLELIAAYSTDPAQRAIGYPFIVSEIGFDKVMAALSNEIAKTGATCPELLLTRANLYLNNGKKQLAINDWKRVAAIPASSVRGIIMRAHAYQLLEQHEQAIKLCTEAIALDTKDCNGYEFRGLVRVCQGKWKEAEADYTRALELDPSDIEAYHGRAQARINLKKLDGALDDTAKTMLLEPLYSYPLRAHIFEQIGQLKNALTAISVVAKNSDRINLLQLRNDLLVKSILQNIVDESNIGQFLDPQHLGNTDVLVGAATIANQIGKYKTAMVIANDILAKEPSSVGALLQKGCAEVGLGEETQANNLLRKALSLKHTSSDEVVATQIKAKLLDRNGKQSEVLALWTRLIQKYPKEAGAYYARASEYRRLKNYPKGLADSEAAVKLNPRPTLYWALEIELMELTQKPPEQIIKKCTEASTLFPNHSWFYEIRAQSYRQLGDDEHELQDRDRLKHLRAREKKHL